MVKLVLLRHGESIWNKENRFTGWTDVDLSEKGIIEANDAGDILKKNKFSFDLAYTSYLKRAIRTLWIVLDKMDLMNIPVSTSWRLNERHYGALQGLNKSETAKRFSEEQVLLWRRSYDVKPPQLKLSDPRHPRNDQRYKQIDKKELPSAECLKDTVARTIPYYKSTIVPQLKKGKKIIIAAHGNSLRALVKYLDTMDDTSIAKLNIPTGIPLIYELNSELKPRRHYYLADDAKLKEAQEKVAAQGKAK